MTQQAKLGDFLRDVSNWYWTDFVQAENDRAYSSSESIIFALVRAVALEKLDAMKIALDRLDGKLKTQIKVETPKVYYIFPKAVAVDDEMEVEVRGNLVDKVILDAQVQVYQPRDDDAEFKPEPETIVGEMENDLPSLSLRQTLSKMADMPRELPDQILANKLIIEEHFRGGAVQLPPEGEIPRVKSVLAACLLDMAQRGKINALYEVFDQIDGKLVETIEILGEDILIPDYRLTAPAGAKKNADGVYQIVAQQSQDIWAQKLLR